MGSYKWIRRRVEVRRNCERLSDLADCCWLYMYENRRQNSIYIGIATSMARVYQRHNEAAEQLRDAPGSVILQTVEPFSSRRDARKAEAIAIHVATIAGTQVCTDDEVPLTNTNIAGIHSTTVLGPAIFTKDEAIQWSSLIGTVIVPIAADELEGRPAPFGGHGGAFFADRARKHWNVAQVKRPRIRRIIALLKGGPNIILGDWDVDPEGDWTLDSVHTTRVAVPLIDAERDDPRGDKGKRLDGHHLNSGVTYSADLK
ncbi:hypothetical protein [Cryobacterium sp. TMT1-2-2]|uniref:hypothetical protein n=1 Tax=Cryobacterium sp. TMT1-2-2 TaxID=1259233 RepID=UPI00141A8D40|nr:hypothetical protein [Cryobacterium sp. TMT1-2-2]